MTGTLTPDNVRGPASRRRFLRYGLSGIAVLAAVGATGFELVDHDVLPGKSELEQLDGACDVPAPDLAPYAAPGPERSGTFYSAARRTTVGYTIGYPPGHGPGESRRRARRGLLRERLPHGLVLQRPGAAVSRLPGQPPSCSVTSPVICPGEQAVLVRASAFDLVASRRRRTAPRPFPPPQAHARPVPRGRRRRARVRPRRPPPGSARPCRAGRTRWRGLLQRATVLAWSALAGLSSRGTLASASSPGNALASAAR